MSPHAQASRASSASGDRRLIDDGKRCLREALELWHWWRRTDRESGYARRFALSETAHRPDHCFGFFDETRVGGRHIGVMGNVQEQFFDRPKHLPPRNGEDENEVLRRSAALMRDQVRELVLRYFLRISGFRGPSNPSARERDRPQTPGWMQPFSWCPADPERASGFGYEQLFFETHRGEVGQFEGGQRFEIVDLRELREKYAWVILRVDIFDFAMELAPFGPDKPHGVLPMPEASYLVISPELVIDEEDPRPGELGRFGFAYGFLPKADPGLLAYGPGRFEVAFQHFEFIVSEAGEITARLAFASNRPEKIVDFSPDPVRWGLRAADLFSLGSASRFLGPLAERMPRPSGVDVVSGYIEMANLLTGGATRARLCMTREQLERQFLALHFRQHFDVIASLLTTWRQFSNWLDAESLPEWVRSGRGA